VLLGGAKTAPEAKQQLEGLKDGGSVYTDEHYSAQSLRRRSALDVSDRATIQALIRVSKECRRRRRAEITKCRREL